jgi:hypothetical protein
MGRSLVLAGLSTSLAVAYTIKGRTVVAIVNVASDGSLSDKRLRRADRGSKVTEIWKKV